MELMKVIFSCVVLFISAQGQTEVHPHKTPNSYPTRESSSFASTTKSSPNSSSAPNASLSTNVGVDESKTELASPPLQGLCEKTGHPALCSSSIAPFFNGKTDIISLVEVMIKVGTDQTKQAMDLATKKALGSTVDAKTASRYKDCNENYDDALDNLQAALDTIPQNDIFTLETMISACISDYSTCDDGFTGQPDPNSVGVSPMAKTNENLMNICDIILTFAKMTH